MPRFVGPIPDKWDPRWFADLIGEIQRELDRLSTPISGGYTVTNATEDRAYDADTVAVAELADVVATLIDDLQTKGVIE